LWPVDLLEDFQVIQLADWNLLPGKDYRAGEKIALK